MNEKQKQQLIISGVGGQGVLFVTRLLAEAAIRNGYSVFTSETHGMAQRGGTVVSHLKIGDFKSPLIRPFQSDGLILLKAGNIATHGFFLKPGGWIVANSPKMIDVPDKNEISVFDADGHAKRCGHKKSANLALLGFALSWLSRETEHEKQWFCTLEDIKDVLSLRIDARKQNKEALFKILEGGMD